MDISAAYPSKYFKKEDFPLPRVVTIDTVTMEDLSMDDKPAQIKPVVYFLGAPKGMAIGKTVALVMTAMFGTSETDQWKGKQVEVFNDVTVVYNGQIGGLRVRPVQGVAQPVAHEVPQPYTPPAPRQAPPAPATDNPGQPADFNDDIPW